MLWVPHPITAPSFSPPQNSTQHNDAWPGRKLMCPKFFWEPLMHFAMHPKRNTIHYNLTFLRWSPFPFSYLPGSVRSAWHVSSVPVHWSPVADQVTCFGPWCTPDRWRRSGQSSVPWSRRWAEEGSSPPPDGFPHSCLLRLTRTLFGRFHSNLGRQERQTC